MHVLSVENIEGKCEVRKKNDIPACDAPAIFQQVFFCERLYDPSKGSLKQVLSLLLPFLVSRTYKFD
jgi:DNA (cytosine-5)-methyltransferase 1